MITPEVNEVSLDKLFKYSGEFTLNLQKPVKVYIRLVGDAELNIARVKALRASTEMRKKLSDKNSDEYLAFIGDKSLFDREKLISLIILRKSVDVSREAIREVSIPFPAEPDEEATLEEQEKYQAAVDNYAKELNEKVSEYVRSKLDEEKRKLESLPDDELFKIYEEAQINGICEEEMVKTYRQYCAYFGTYKDKKFTKRMFSSYEEFDNLRPEIKNAILEFYDSLDIPPEDLKK